jgi:HAE1 family hydrophobic/amphiphilic exporter-1
MERVYLIKKPQDQYQVILEIADDARAHPEDLSRLYIRSDDGTHLVPLRALVTWKTSLGPQAVNHLNQFTSVTLFFDLKPGVAIGEATDFITKAATSVVPPTLRASLQGEALTFQNTVRDLTLLMALAVFVMYVILAILYVHRRVPVAARSAAFSGCRARSASATSSATSPSRNGCRRSTPTPRWIS